MAGSPSLWAGYSQSMSSPLKPCFNRNWTEVLIKRWRFAGSFATCEYLWDPSFQPPTAAKVFTVGVISFSALNFLIFPVEKWIYQNKIEFICMKYYTSSPIVFQIKVSINNSKFSTFLNTKERICQMGAKIWINMFHIKFTITWSVCWPRSMVANDIFCLNKFVSDKNNICT